MQQFACQVEYIDANTHEKKETQDIDNAHPKPYIYSVSHLSVH